MPKFITYQRPAPVNKSSWGGQPGAPYGKPGKQPRKGPPETRVPQLELKLKHADPPKGR
jgi:hypothetical protein